MENKQTAIEWLEQELFRRYNFIDDEFIFHQAKAMEKEQITDAYLELMCDEYGYEVAPQSWILTAEYYYNETYGTSMDKKG